VSWKASVSYSSAPKVIAAMTPAKTDWVPLLYAFAPWKGGYAQATGVVTPALTRTLPTATAAKAAGAPAVVPWIMSPTALIGFVMPEAEIEAHVAQDDPSDCVMAPVSVAE